MSIQPTEKLVEMPEGQGEPCYYCGQPCDSLAGNPGRWAVPLCHKDDPGVVKWHHEGCVSERLERAEAAEAQLATVREQTLEGLIAHLKQMRKKHEDDYKRYPSGETNQLNKAMAEKLWAAECFIRSYVSLPPYKEGKDEQRS